MLAVGVTGPSLPVCPLVNTILSSLSNSGFTGHFSSRLNGTRCALQANTGRANASFDQSLSSISQSRFCTQGLRTLAQVAVAYLGVSKTPCFPGITSGTVSPGPIPKYPGRAPKGASLVASMGFGVGLHGAGLSSLSRGFSAHLRAHCCGVLLLGTLSVRDVVALVPRPTGSLTARVLRNGGSALPRVGTCLCPLFSFSVNRYLGLRWSPLAPARLNRAPRSGCDSPPRPLPSVSPFQT